MNGDQPSDERPPTSSTSELGCNPDASHGENIKPNDKECENVSRVTKNSMIDEKWHLLFEMQNANMKALIEALSKLQLSSRHEIKGKPPKQPNTVCAARSSSSHKKQTTSSSIVCFKCGQTSYISLCCTSGETVLWRISATSEEWTYVSVDHRQVN